MLKTMFLAILLAGVGLSGAHAAEAAWLTDYAQAKAQAATSHKPMLLDFTGSDWCSWCIKFDKEVLATPEFQKYAADNLVLVKLDFPQTKPQPAAEKKQNEDLAKKFGVQGFPTFLLLSPDEKVLTSQVGYAEGGPKAFVDKLASAKK
jgi:protein disulfide-isomerase